MRLFRHICVALCCIVLFSSFDFAEHKKVGDEAFIIIPYRLVEAGIFPTVEAARAALHQMYKLEVINNNVHLPILKGLSLEPNQVSYGILNALSGDHVSNPMLLEHELQTPFSKTNRILALEIAEMNKFNPGAKPMDVLDINPAYGMMAIRDLSHFLNYGSSLNEHLNMIDVGLIEKLKDLQNVDEVYTQLESSNSLTKYYTIHIFATYLAQQAGKAFRAGDLMKRVDLMYYALLNEAFAQHFLQDCFASGHMFVNRGFTASAVVNNKALHDFYNGVRTKSMNLKGESWFTLGDKQMNSRELNDNEYEYLRVENQQFKMYDGIPDSAYNNTERKTKLLSQMVRATTESMLEVWKMYHNAESGDEKDVIEELKANKDNIDKFIFENSKVVYCIAVPFGSHSSEMPTNLLDKDKVAELDLTVAPPFSRGFIRSRVANAFMVTLGLAGLSNFAIGGRLNLSMINFNTAHLGRSGLRKGKVIHWINPTLSGFYSRNPDFVLKGRDVQDLINYLKLVSGDDLQNYMWNIKGGLNYTCDIFVSDKRFLSLFAYLEGGIDVRDKVFIDKNVYVNPDFSNFEKRYTRINVTNPTFVPTFGVQLGSLIGLHRFTVPSWIRIPLYIILPLKVSASYHTTRSMNPMWTFNTEIDILF